MYYQLQDEKKKMRFFIAEQDTHGEREWFENKEERERERERDYSVTGILCNSSRQNIFPLTYCVG